MSSRIEVMLVDHVDGARAVRIDSGDTVGDLIDEQDYESPVKFKVNNVVAGRDHVLEAGDRVVVGPDKVQGA